MKYRAIAITTKPLIVWQGWTGNPDSLTIDEIEVPEPIYGVCPWKIEAGNLVDRTPDEMAVFEIEYNQELATRKYATRVDALATAYFTWNTFKFPMYEIARLYYSCIKHTPGNYKVQDMGGQIRDVMNADNVDFLNAYFSKLNELTHP